VAIGFLFALSIATPTASFAAGPPQIVSSSVEGVSATAATLRATVNPNGLPTSYRFEYLAESAYAANPPLEPFRGASLAPVSGSGAVGAGEAPVALSQHVSGLSPLTAYRYRVRAANSAETVYGATRPFATQAPTNAFSLLDGRGWELVSPIEKNGGSIPGPGEVAGGGVFQAAASGGAITFSAATAFGADASSAPPGSQYLATRGAEGWATTDISTPLLSGSYGDEPDGVPYQLFSSGLDRGLMSNGERCRGQAGGECPVANPSLPESGAPAGYRNYYVRQGGRFASILTAGDLSHTSLSASQLELRSVAATADLSHIVLTSCAALAPGATEVAAPGGCSEAAQNLYEWSGGALVAINFAPGETTTSPGAAIAAQSGSISSDGSRVYWTQGGDLYLREGGATKLLGANATFQTASESGTVAYYTEAGHLYRYAAQAGTSVDLTPAGGVQGVLGAAAEGSDVYYASGAGVFVWRNGTTVEVAAAATASDYPPSTGTARVSPDGAHLLFLSDAELTGYPNEGRTEVFLFGPGAAGPLTLVCVSCNPSGERPRGSASIPGAVANGTGAGATAVYKPRSLSAEGNRVFFDTGDSLVPQDTNERPDVYEWEAGGIGTCGQAGGCVQLISSGRDAEPSSFIDASADGSDAYFLTAASLYPLDPGADDIYDARIGGGYPVPPTAIACVADACQVLPEAPEDPTPGTLVPNSGNPPTVAEKAGKSHKKKKHKHRKAKKKGKGTKTGTGGSRNGGGKRGGK
jgi:hypothetical protein